MKCNRKWVIWLRYLGLNLGLNLQATISGFQIHRIRCLLQGFGTWKVADMAMDLASNEINTNHTKFKDLVPFIFLLIVKGMNIFYYLIIFDPNLYSFSMIHFPLKQI